MLLLPLADLLVIYMNLLSLGLIFVSHLLVKGAMDPALDQHFFTQSPYHQVR